ncbi:MAG: hypothetical protein J6B95_01905 [Oscillospiraceae bacterium]|nr:hypothetical protein [Oscillospiraceae bacterium]
MTMSILVLKTNAAMEYAAKYLKKADLNITDVPDYDVEHLLLSIPSFAGGSRYITPILASLPHSATVSGGNLDHPAVESYRRIDFLRDPYYLATNAAITADCAIALANRQWQELPVLILGWGRIGKCLGQKLSRLGADVTIAARKDADLAMIRALGANSIPVDNASSCLMKYRAIFNTVPEMILPDFVCHKDCIALELASKPGMAGDGIISARGLPGKYAPEASGKLIAQTFVRLALGREDTL